jgi:hypothetical protein
MNRQTTLPRRRLLAGALALPAATAAVAFPVLAAAEQDPDAELLELGRQHAEADARYDDLSDRCEDAHEAAIAAYPPMPEALRVRQNDGLSSWPPELAKLQSDGFYNCAGVERWRGRAPSGGILWPPAAIERFDARRAEVLAAWEWWSGAKEQANVAFGVRELERQLDAQGYAVTEIEHRIFALPAKTPAGWQLKAKLAKRVVVEPYETDGTYEDHMIRSLLADLTAEAA